MTDDPIEVEGEYTSAKIMTQDVEEESIEYLQEICDSEGFQNYIACMPDIHPEPNSRSLIGFTMEMSDKVCPVVTGFDIGCGLSGFSTNSNLPELSEVDEKIRDVVPVGVTTHTDDAPFHIVDDFNWNQYNVRLENLIERVAEDPMDYRVDNYSEYLNDLCQRVDVDINDVISSIGTLGSGNHFIEVCESDSSDDVWVVTHSGSRAIGHNIGEYHQDIAESNAMLEEFRSKMTNPKMMMLNEDFFDEYYKEETMDGQRLKQWLSGGAGGAYYDIDTIKNVYDGEKIEEERQWYVDLANELTNKSYKRAYLEGDEACLYLKDMLFAQMLATANRTVMLQQISEALGLKINRIINNPHNYVDPVDHIMRKGATPARENQRAIIPFNMGVGSVIVEGKGNPDYNNSAPHGAGRPRGRRESEQMISEEEHNNAMQGIYTSSPANEVLDESPRAYKDPEGIRKNMKPTVDVLETLVPIVSVKADYRDIPWKTRE